MNFEGSTPQAVPRFGSVTSYDDPSMLPLGLARIARNCRYTSDSVATRYGNLVRLTFGLSPIGGFAILRYLPQANTIAGTNQEWARVLVYAQNGVIYDADPFVSSTVTWLPMPFVLNAGLNPVFTQAFNRGIVALGNLSTGVQKPLIYDPSTHVVDGASDKPWGFAWLPSILVRVGQVCCPSTPTVDPTTKLTSYVSDFTAGKVYSCTRGGTSAAVQPNWPTTAGATVNDGSVVWQENTPIAIAGLPDPASPILTSEANNAGSPITPNAYLFVALTYVNQQGESINEIVLPTGGIDPSRALQYQNNTANNQQVVVTMPAIPALLATSGPLGVSYGATAYNVYAYIQQGAYDPTTFTDPSYYAQVAANVAPGATTTISAFPVGTSLNTVNSATVTANDGTGAIDVGVRWMVPMFETRTEYITGYNPAIALRINVSGSGQKIRLIGAAVGPTNMTRRIYAFTVAGASSAGPYTYVDAADKESPGFNEPDIQITATTIEDNVSTAAIFNFTDTYLPGASDVTDYADRIEIPAASDVYFAKSQGVVIYTGCAGYDFLVSDQDDPEALRIGATGSNLNVSSNDGDRAVCWREVRETQIACKENSGHAVIPNDGDASTWDVQEIWKGMGPAGPKAIDGFTDDDSAFLLFAHRTGLYKCNGQNAQHVCRELIGTPDNPGVWDQINWTYGNQVVVRINRLQRTAKIYVPYGTSTVNNKCISLNFFFGWGDPVVFSVRSGKLIPNVEGRKWSVDDVAANDAAYLPQRYTANASQSSVDLSANLVLGGLDGGMYTESPGYYQDDHAGTASTGYLSQWVSVPGNNQRNLVGMIGATVSGRGSGFLNVYAYDQTLNLYPLSNSLRTMPLAITETVRDFGAVGNTSTGFGIGFDNGAIAGSWFEVHLATLYLISKFNSQVG